MADGKHLENLNQHEKLQCKINNRKSTDTGDMWRVVYWTDESTRPLTFNFPLMWLRDSVNFRNASLVVFLLLTLKVMILLWLPPRNHYWAKTNTTLFHSHTAECLPNDQKSCETSAMFHFCQYSSCCDVIVPF